MSDTITYDIEELFAIVQEQQESIKKLEQLNMMAEYKISQLKTDLNILQNNNMVVDMNGYQRPARDVIDQMKSTINDFRYNEDDTKTIIAVLVETFRTILESLPDQDRAESLIKIMKKGYCTLPTYNGYAKSVNYTISWDSMTKMAAYLLSQPESLVDSINSLSK